MTTSMQLAFSIECGETTCARVPGEFCRFLQIGASARGVCHFFGPVTEKDGWIQRHKQCLEGGSNHEFQILSVEAQEGGCFEEVVVKGIKTIQEAFAELERVLRDPQVNCSYYIIVEKS